MSFYVVGDPKPQPRPRAFARKMGDKFVARVYDSHSAEHWKTAIAAAAKEAGLVVFDGPVSLDLHFNFKRPKSHFNSKGQVKPSAPICHTQRPDWENLAKVVPDCLMTLGVLRDDSQIIRATVAKDWAIGPSPGGCFITIAALD